MDIVPALQRLGFAEYEARAYLALVKRSPLNGYELAKASGIPRANVYGVLERLGARRAIVRVDEDGGARYAPVPPADLMRRLSGEFEQIADAMTRELQAVESETERDAGVERAGVCGAARSGAGGAARGETVAVACRLASRSVGTARRGRGSERTRRRDHDPLHGRMRKRMRRLPRRGVPLSGNAGGRAAAARRRRRRRGRRRRGDPADGDAHSVRTRQPLLVDLCSSSVRSSIALAAVVADLGPRLDDTLAPETRAAVSAAAPDGDGDSFVDRMRALRIG